jgi:hypothetical protein
MTLLALVEPGMAASAQFRAFEPVEHEQRAFDPPQLLECEVELVLAAVGREFSQHDGRRPDASCQGDRCPSFSGSPAIARPITPLRQLGNGTRPIIVCLYASVRPHGG